MENDPWTILHMWSTINTFQILIVKNSPQTSPTYPPNIPQTPPKHPQQLIFNDYKFLKINIKSFRNFSAGSDLVIEPFVEQICLFRTIRLKKLVWWVSKTIFESHFSIFFSKKSWKFNDISSFSILGVSPPFLIWLVALKSWFVALKSSLVAWKSWLVAWKHTSRA